MFSTVILCNDYICVFLGLRSMFVDAVWIIECYYGIRGIALYMFTSYLHNRKQYTCYIITLFAILDVRLKIDFLMYSYNEGTLF